MTCKVFYSWQSDLPNATNRGFIEKALGNAVKSIRDDGSIQVEPVVDRDTAGVPGAPDIAQTIFDKIDQSQIFVCDVSVINQGIQSRPTPNPNVLIELGYARKVLGFQQIVMVMNSAFGDPTLLPFDLRPRRVITYHMPQESQDRASERKNLERRLEQELRAILTELEKQLPEETVQPSPADQARAAIESVQPNQVIMVRRFMEWLTKEIDTLAPDFSQGGVMDELLVQAIDQTERLVLESAHVAKAIAEANASDAALTVYKDFEHILKYYNPPDLKIARFHRWW